MSRFLNIGIMQMEISTSYEENMAKVEKNIEALMSLMNPPEVILGPEMAFGGTARLNEDFLERLGAIAARHKIYLLPGSIKEEAHEEGKLYNSLPIIGPDGRLIDVYRKICPYYPDESSILCGDRPVVLHIPEKDVRIGVMICHDWCFPEISRTLSLMGADVLFRPAIDPEGLYDAFHGVPAVRALENQAYFISLNACGRTLGSSAYGHSVIADPEGRIVYEGENAEVNLCITLDIDLVRRSRRYGTFFTEQLMRQLKLFSFPEPYGNRADSPLLQALPMPDITPEQRWQDVKEIGLNTTLGKKQQQ